MRRERAVAVGLVAALGLIGPGLGGCTLTHVPRAAPHHPVSSPAASASQSRPSRSPRPAHPAERPEWTRARTLKFARLRLHLTVVQPQLRAIERRPDFATAVTRLQATKAARRAFHPGGARVAAEMFVGNDANHTPRLLWLVVFHAYGHDEISRFNLPRSENPLVHVIDSVPVAADTGVPWWADSR